MIQVSVEVNKKQHKYVIGPKGQGLQEILAQYQTSVEVPPLDNPSTTITLRGKHLLTCLLILDCRAVIARVW